MASAGVGVGIYPVTGDGGVLFSQETISNTSRNLSNLFITAVKWANWIKTDTLSLSKTCKLLGYAAQIQGGALAQTAEFWKKFDSILDASFSLDDSAYLIKKLFGEPESSRMHTYGRMSLFVADVGGLTLMAEGFGAITLASATVSGLSTMVVSAVAIAFVFLGYDAYQCLSDKMNGDKRFNTWTHVAHSAGEVAVHALMAVGHQGVYKIATGTFACGTHLIAYIHKKTMEENAMMKKYHIE